MALLLLITFLVKIYELNIRSMNAFMQYIILYDWIFQKFIQTVNYAYNQQVNICLVLICVVISYSDSALKKSEKFPNYAVIIPQSM